MVYSHEFSSSDAFDDREPRSEIECGVAEEPREPGRLSQDASLALPSEGVFAVFDGMGGMQGDPAAAAKAGVEAISYFYNRAQQFEDEAALLLSLKESFELARQNVLREGHGGTTVGSLAVVANVDDTTMLGVAHCGDTRVYLYSNEGIAQLTDDQGEGRSVFNCMGIETMPQGAMEDDFFVMNVVPGDRVMICSDGITGDYSHQAFSDAEMRTAFGKNTPTESADEFLAISKGPNKKADDKTVVVFDIPVK